MTRQKWDRYPRKEETGLPKIAILFQFKFYQNLSEKVVAVAEAVAVIEATAVALAVAVAIAGMAAAKVAKEEVATPVTCWAGAETIGQGQQSPHVGGRAETTGQGQQSPHVGWTAGQGQKDAQKRQKATATN